MPLKVLDDRTGDTALGALTQKRFKIFMFLLRSCADKHDICQIDAAKKYKNKSFLSRTLAVTGFWSRRIPLTPKNVYGMVRVSLLQ